MQEKSNNPDVLAAGQLKSPCWTGMMSSNDYSWVYDEKLYVNWYDSSIKNPYKNNCFVY